MLQLVDFVVRNRFFLVFILLEVLSVWLIVRSNTYWGATYFNTSNYYVAKTLAFSNSARQYTKLDEVNSALANENARLRATVTALTQTKPIDSPAGYVPDSSFASRFTFTVAKVVDNETNKTNNVLTIDKGTSDGIKPGMGVISATGVVGKVRFCSDNYSVVTSILHSQFMVSSKLVRSKEIGYAKWPGKDPNIIDMIDVSKYTKIFKGDSAVTSDQNSVFPPGIMVGRVETVTVHPNQTFYNITLRLATDFRNLSYVYVVQNQQLGEQDSLKLRTINTK
ncbi:rod shape-determining protein MreC [Dyadobacter chenwenxiniae]|uniref:Cell shape-determining protein MreC n=1 Tax=Dyadobacter chenwenxiniae TaxID=2906456 RepID=A0A9X1TF08_9BACT|nr:rod shape-determining protein MreC [Dyadobacter chenwenxiniae]MCF0049758.1 rod shape-determining protein MreC [Dyadobacter chenwenxiniae]MCF0062184.1 rod shape-determining protein MreC [Dyadobacter chenwenxiniae]UON81986.1 rod shape-determining protein MreC [Dyadobacter chenwenxiniae]